MHILHKGSTQLVAASLCCGALPAHSLHELVHRSCLNLEYLC
jgi:hypothetical protein